jgi:septal ring factor EnvC (AmiA/AmiB activator)
VGLNAAQEKLRGAPFSRQAAPVAAALVGTGLVGSLVANTAQAFQNNTLKKELADSTAERELYESQEEGLIQELEELQAQFSELEEELNQTTRNQERQIENLNLQLTQLETEHQELQRRMQDHRSAVSPGRSSLLARLISPLKSSPSSPSKTPATLTPTRRKRPREFLGK